MSKIKMSSNRNFGLVFFIVFLLIAFWPFQANLDQIKIWPLCLSLIFLVLGLLNSKLLTPLNKIWTRFGVILGIIVSPIIMSFIFFLVLTPIGLFIKILGRDLLNKKYDKKAKSYWIKRNVPIGTMKRQF